MYLSIAEMYENAFIQATTSGSLVYCYWQNCFGHFCSSFFCISSYFPGLIPIMKLPKTHQHFLGFKYIVLQFSSVQSLSRVRLFSTPWIAAHQASLSITNPGVHWDSRPSSQWCHPAISSSVVPFSSCPIPLSIRVFSNESTLRMSWPKYWSFSFCISPSNDHPWLISFRMDWVDLLAVQGTLKSLLQHHCSKASI